MSDGEEINRLFEKVVEEQNKRSPASEGMAHLIIVYISNMIVSTTLPNDPELAPLQTDIPTDILAHLAVIDEHHPPDTNYQLQS